MKPAAFDYHAPESLEEALELLASHEDDAKPLAGGQSLMPLMNFRLATFGHLVDLGRIEALRGIRREGDELVIGAATRQRDIERSDEVAAQVPLLAEATKLIGHFQIRNRGTIGGSLAHADPAAEYPAVAVALDATIEVAGGSGTRTIAADDLFDSAYATTLEPDEIITAVRVPVQRPGESGVIRELTRRHGDFALTGCVVRLGRDGAGAVETARVVIFGVAGRPLRLEGVEQALLGASGSAPDVGDAIDAATADLAPHGDAVVSSAYRVRVTRHITRAAIADAFATEGRATS